MVNYVDYSRILSAMFDGMKRGQTGPKAAELRKLYSPKGFINEFGTLKLSGPRRSGHSTAIVNLLKEEPYSIVLVPHLANRYPFTRAGIEENRILTFKNTNQEHFKNRIRGQRIDYIFVDNAFYMSKKWVKFLTEVLCVTSEPNHTRGIILVN